MSNLEPQALTPAPATVVGAGVKKPRKRRHYSLLNRRDKILLSLMVGIPLAIFLVLCATTRGKPLFWQRRAGYLGRTFRMVKFRTMRPGAATLHFWPELRAFWPL